MERRCEKKGQVTIFIILAIIVVAGIIVSFFFMGGMDILTGKISDPTAYIKDCAEKNAKVILDNLEQHGGIYYSESKSYDFLKFAGLDIAKLCYSSGNKTICENKHPMFNEEIEYQIKNYVKPRLEECFSELSGDYKSQDFSQGVLNFSVKIEKDGVLLIIRKSIEIINGDNSVRVNNFDVSLDSDIYEFLEITNSVLNQELSCDCETGNCNADLGKINIWYPQYSTSRFLTENSDKIYTILSNDNENKFMFAIKNCVGIRI